MPKRGSGKLYELNGERHTLTEWCRIYHTSSTRTADRLKNGYSLLDALTLPMQSPYANRKRKEAQTNEKSNGDNRRETACR